MASEIREVAQEVADRIRRRGIPLSGDERPDDLGDLLTAIERFESAVQTRGGDLMVDDLKSSQPDDPHFVLPPRDANESVRDYVVRIDAATAQVRSHRDISPDINA